MKLPCPQCQNEIQPTWDWCENCGYDPDGLRGPDAPLAPRTPSPPPVYPPQTYAVPVYSPPTFAPAPDAPPGYAPPGYGPPGYGPPGYGPPGSGSMPYGAPPRSTGPSVGKVLGAIALAFVLLAVVCVAAVTLLGRNPRPSSVAAGTGSPGVSSIAPAPAVWTPWTASDGSFTISFPGAPEVGPVGISDPKLKAASMATYDNTSVVYAVMWMEPAAGYAITDNTVMLNAVADGSATQSGITYSERRLGDFAGNPAMFLEGTASNVTMQGMAMISGQRVYLFLAGAPSGRTADFATFQGSFHIL